MGKTAIGRTRQRHCGLNRATYHPVPPAAADVHVLVERRAKAPGTILADSFCLPRAASIVVATSVCCVAGSDGVATREPTNSGNWACTYAYPTCTPLLAGASSDVRNSVAECQPMGRRCITNGVRPDFSDTFLKKFNYISLGQARQTVIIIRRSGSWTGWSGLTHR